MNVGESPCFEVHSNPQVNLYIQSIAKDNMQKWLAHSIAPGKYLTHFAMFYIRVTLDEK